MVTEGGADRRSTTIADRPINQSHETRHLAVQTALRPESTSCRSASETTSFSSRQATAVHDRDVLSDRCADRPTARRTSAMSPKLLVLGLMLNLDPWLRVSTSITVRVRQTSLKNGTDQRFRWSAWVWSPGRNRTGDPILTMDRRPTAVLSGVFAGWTTP